MRITIITLLSILLIFGSTFAQDTTKELNDDHNKEYIEHQHLKNREEGKVSTLIKSLDLLKLKERLIKEASASEEDFNRFLSFFEFNLKFYILELKSKVEEPGFNQEKFEAFVGQKFRESLFEFKRFLQEDQEFRSRVEKTQYDQLYNSVYKINPHQHSPNQPMAAGQPCQNMDFCNGTSNWVGNYCRGLGWSDINDAQCWNGFGNGQYTKMTGGNDGNFGAIPRVPPGSSCALRLGDTSPNNDKATISQTFRVSQNNYIFVYKWAAVLDNNGNHSAATSPYFRVRMYRNFGTGSQQEISCATVNANSQTANSWGFSSSGGYRFKNWTTMFIPLDAYIGQDITIWFETSDCMVDGGTHEGYAYIWASCLPPTFTLSKPALCSGGTLTITAPAGAENYSWYSSPPGAIQGSTSGQTITATQGNATYYVTMTTNTQAPYVPCSITLDTLVSGSSGAVSPNFSPADACQGSPTTFTDLSTPSGQITTWNWDFNNDGTSDASGQNPTYTFPNAGVFPVKLTISNGSCPKDTTINVTVLPNPTANFTVNPVCIGDTSRFTNTSTPPVGGSITGNDWEFGDVNSSSANNPVHFYATAGTFNVTLITTADNGCTATITKPATVNGLPNVDAGPFQNFCLGSNASLNGSGASSYIWSNGVSNGVAFSPTTTNTYTVTGTDANGCKNTDTVTIRVNPIPVSDFSASNACLNLANNFTNNSSISGGTITNYNWDFGDGNTANTQNASHTYSASGTYQVKLIVTSNMNCTDTLIKSVIVYSLPNVIASSPDHEICLNENTSISASGASSYSWTPATYLSSSTNANITLTPFNTITYTLTGTDANNCINTDTVNIIVNPLPIADFTSTNACFNQQQNTFTDASTISAGTISNWQWNFNNNESNSTAQNPGYSFNSDGTKSVTLIVTSAKGCKDTTSKNTLVYALPNADFNVQNVCIGFNIQLNNMSTNGSGTINTNTWQFGDGNNSGATNPTHSYSSPNTYNIQLNVSDNNNCKDSIQKQVTVYPLPTINASSSDSYICLNETTGLNASGGSTYTWSNSMEGNFSNNQNTTVTPSSSVTYTVTSADVNGCINTDTINVIVNPLPIANFNGTNACLNQQSNQLSDLSTVNSGSITGWSWSTSGQATQTNQNPTFTFTSSGTKDIELIVSTNAGCKDTITKTVEVYVLPTANFSITNVCKGAATTLTNTSINGSGTINTLNWDLGDGNISSQNNPTHTYSNDGNFTASLYISDSNGCKDTVQKLLTVYPLPTVSFNATSVCALKPTILTGTSTISSGNISNWAWYLNSDNIVDAVTSSTTYTYTTGGTYPVKLVNTSNQGCKDSLTKNINVNFIPVADFSNINKCLYDSIPFTNQSTVAQGTIASYDWIFGDGGVSSNTNPYHTYTSCGVKAVTLVSTSDSGCVNAQTKQVTVFCKPTATIVTADVCANITANFSGITSVSTDGTISAYSWNFGNGQTSSASTANISYLSGNYNVSLIVQSNNGCLDTTSVPIEIFPVPSAGFNVNDSCFGTSTCFTNTSSISSGNISSYCWDFNGSINTCESSNQTPCNIFPAVGIYNTTLITTSDKGCLDTITKTHTIFPLPVVNFSSSDVCIGNEVNFTNNTSISSGSIGNYSWNFGDNQTSNVVDPINNYLNSGTYSVSLIATSDKGCLDSLKKTVNVYPKPEANFESNLLEGCEPLCVNLNNLSTTNNNPPNSISQYFWEASNGWSSNSNSPTNVCFDAGDYDVKLTIVSDKGCSDTISFINYLHSYPLPVADFKFNPASTTILQSSITFVDESTGGKTISWDFGDNDTTYLIDGENLIHTYADTGEYIVTQIVISEYGCIDSIKKTVIIGPDWTFYIPNAFTPNEDGINDFYNGKGYGIKEYALIIFDRWGNLIARIDDINSKGWNGTVEPYSEPCQIDTYVYKVALTDVFDKRHYYTGTFHLVR